MCHKTFLPVNPPPYPPSHAHKLDISDELISVSVKFAPRPHQAHGHKLDISDELRSVLVKFPSTPGSPSLQVGHLRRTQKCLQQFSIIKKNNLIFELDLHQASPVWSGVLKAATTVINSPALQI